MSAARADRRWSRRLQEAEPCTNLTGALIYVDPAPDRPVTTCSAAKALADTIVTTGVPSTTYIKPNARICTVNNGDVVFDDTCRNATDKAACTRYDGTLISLTAVPDVVTTCFATASFSIANTTNTTIAAYDGLTATTWTVINGTVDIRTCNVIGNTTGPLPAPTCPGPSPSPSSSPPPRKKSSSSAGPAAGGAIGGILGLAIIAGLVWFFVIRKRGSQLGTAQFMAYFSKQPFKATPTDAAAHRNQGSGRPTTFPVGKDPAMLSRRHEDLKQAVQSFETCLLSLAPLDTGFWRQLVAQAPALGAVAPVGTMGPYLLRHHIWRWLDANLWARRAPLAKPPIFPQGRSTAAYDSALTNLKVKSESYREFSSQAANRLAHDLQLPAEGQVTYQDELQYLVECAAELRLAVGVVDPNATIVVAHIDTGASPLHLRPTNSSQQVFRSLAIDPAAASRVTNGVALCHVPGIGHRTRSYMYELEQVIAAVCS